MALNTPTPWLLAYDIRDPKRLTRLHRYMKKQGIPMQYSVFLLYATARQIENIKQEVCAIIDERKDDVRIYHLGNEPHYTAIGKSLIPIDVQILAAVNLRPDHGKQRKQRKPN